MDTLRELLQEYKVAVMLVLFAGVLYWAFKSRFQRRK
jgi:cbb3-type cytochrome oxidase subunit 3